MRCVVVTDFDIWYFATIVEARKWAKILIDYSEKHGVRGVYPNGGGAEWVDIWKESEWEDEDGIWESHWESPEVA